MVCEKVLPFLWMRNPKQIHFSLQEVQKEPLEHGRSAFIQFIELNNSIIQIGLFNLFCTLLHIFVSKSVDCKFGRMLTSYSKPSVIRDIFYL